MTPPKSSQLPPLACPILAFPCSVPFVPSPSGRSTLLACCYRSLSIPRRLAHPSVIAESREITTLHSGGTRPCSSARCGQISRSHVSIPAPGSSEQACPKSPERDRLTYPA